jgi:MFS family permease
VGHYFRERRGLATGLASTGGGIGGVVFPLLLQHTLPRLGWAWSVRVLGFVCLVFIVICNLLVRKRLPPVANASPHPDFRIFSQPAFLFTTIGVFLLEFSLFIPLAYISSYALAVGFSESLSFTVIVVLNASSVLGRVMPVYWADRIGPFNSNMLCLLLSAIACLCVWLPAGHTLPGLFIFAILFGFGTGSNISLTPVCVGQLCHTHHYGRYYATCYTVVSVACLVGIPIAGAIVEACKGDYWGLIVVTGIVDLFALAAFVAAKVACVGWRVWAKF